MPVRQKSIECWVLSVGYTVILRTSLKGATWRLKWGNHLKPLVSIFWRWGKFFLFVLEQKDIVLVSNKNLVVVVGHEFFPNKFAQTRKKWSWNNIHQQGLSDPMSLGGAKEYFKKAESNLWMSNRCFPGQETKKKSNGNHSTVFFFSIPKSCFDKKVTTLKKKKQERGSIFWRSQVDFLVSHKKSYKEM